MSSPELKYFSFARLKCLGNFLLIIKRERTVQKVSDWNSLVILILFLIQLFLPLDKNALFHMKWNNLIHIIISDSIFIYFLSELHTSYNVWGLLLTPCNVSQINYYDKRVYPLFTDTHNQRRVQELVPAKL